MRMINKIADRLLSSVAPKITAAGICCPDFGNSYEQDCGCSNGFQKQMFCVVRCNCSIQCNACVQTTDKCGTV